MPILSVKTDIAGESGLSPKFIYINTTDTSIQISQPGYLNTLTNFGVEIRDGWMALVAYFTPGPIRVKRLGLFDLERSGNLWSLIEYDPTGGASGNVGPGTVDKIAKFTLSNKVQDSGITENVNEFAFDRPIQMYNATSNPASVAEGASFWKSDTKEFRIFDGTSYISIGGAGTDVKDLKITASDTTAAFLDSKLVVSGSEITKAVLNPAANEQLQLSINVGVVSGSVAAGDDSRFPTIDEKAALVGTGTPSALDLYVNNSDARMTDSRTPSGSANGDVTGSYPSSLVVSSMTTTSGPQSLLIGAIADGQTLQRSGTSVIGVTPTDSDELVKILGTDTTSGYLDAKLVVLGSEITKTILNPTGDSDLQLSINIGTTSGSVCAGDDARLSDARVPTGAAGGDLSGTYSSPSVAAITTTSGPTSLTIGAVADGQVLQRSGATVIGVTSVGTDQFVKILATDTTAAYLDDKIVISGTEIAKTILNPTLDADLQLSINVGTTSGSVAAGDDSRIPTQDENDALQGTDGSPSNANRYVTNSDSRNTDSRTPSGSASGDLGGTYPSPSVDAVTTTTGPTSLSIGAIADGESLQRSGTSIIGYTPTDSDEFVKVVVTDTTPGYLDAKVVVSGTEITKTILNPTLDADLQLAINVGTTAGSVSAGNDSRFPTSDEKAALAGTGVPSGANVYVTNDDSRLSDSRSPSGLASGDLSGSYPGPSVSAITTTSGPTSLTIGAIADGEFLQRSGTSIISAAPPSDIKDLKITVADTTAGFLDSKLVLSGSEISKAVLNPAANEQLQLSINVGAVAGTVCAGDDSRLSDSRTPTGAASGDLGGNYPGPSVSAITTTSGPTSLLIGVIADGQSLQRSGTSIIGYTPVDSDEFVKVVAGDTTPGYLDSKIVLSGTEISKQVLNPTGDSDLELSINVGTGAGSVAAGNDSRIPTQDENDALVGTGTPSAANVYVTNDDSRLSDARTPTGSANGDVTGSYPSSLIVSSITTTSGPQSLLIGAVADGQVLQRSGTSLIGVTPSGGDVTKFDTTVDERLARWNGADLASIQNSAVSLTDAGAISGLTTVTATSFNGVALTTTGAATNFLDETGNYTEKVFGNDYQNSQVAGPFTTTSLTYVDVTSIVTPTLTGTYRLSLSWSFDNTSKVQRLRLYDDSAAAIIGVESVVKINENDSEWAFAKTAIVTLTAQSKTFKVQLLTDDNGEAASVSAVVFEFWRVS